MKYFSFQIYSIYISSLRRGVSWKTLWQVVAISVGVVSVAVGIGIPVFYESQIDNAVSFDSSPCFFFPLVICCQ